MDTLLTRDAPTAGASLADALGGDFDTGLRARMLAGLFAAGATLALLTVALPHSRRASDIGLLVVVGNAYAVAALLAWRAERFPEKVLPVTLAWGSTLITAVAYFSAENPSPLVFFYLWVILFCSYFFTTRQIVVEVAYVGVAYFGLLLARQPPGGLPAWWLVGMGTLTVAAFLVHMMRERVESLIARLYDAARSDPLTKLANRHGFRELLDLELERARRGGVPLTLVTGDLDHFKEVNDRAGRQVGDAMLRRAAGVLAHHKRRIDALARVGGGEFALLLPDSDAHDAFTIAERLRASVQEAFASDAVTLTISFGVASHPRDGPTAAALLRAAGEALHAAKRNGGNRTMLYSSELPLLTEGDDHSRDVAAERFLAVMLDLAEAVDLRFSGSARHSETVGRYAEMMARELGLSEERAIRVRLAGMLHDIGKAGVPDSILNKPGSLTEEEFDLIRGHPELGAQILEHPTLVDVREWVGAHHERPDGNGYPRGLRGEEIPLEARILAVADAYEAMTCDRAYRASMSNVDARAELARGAGTQFDARVVQALFALLDRHAERALTAAADRP